MEGQQNESSQGRTGKVTAWIGGVTALVVALGGLATATKEIWGGDKDAKANTVQQGSETRKVRIHAVDRMKTLRKPAGI